jgi:hypothetical protein
MADKIKTDETLPDVPASKVKEAQMEGIQNAIAESAEARFKATDGNLPGEETGPGIVKTNDATHMDWLLDMDPEMLTKTLTGKGELSPIPTQGQIASLLEMERSGQNRTDTVDALCKVLGIKSPYEVTDAGPAWTNVVNRKVLER